MADITSKLQGNVSDEGQQGPWREGVAPVGGQSIYDSSSVQLAELGSRKVVGDRVFRYAQANATIGAGLLVEWEGEALLVVTAGTTNPAGAKVFTWYAATAITKDTYVDGYLIAQSGTNTGYCYKIKSNPAISALAKGDLVLYDPLKVAVNVTDLWSIFQNPYRNLGVNTAGTAPTMGVSPIPVTTGDYFWLQTWGPCALKSSAVAAYGRLLGSGATGEVYDAVIGTTARATVVIGMSMQVMTASQKGLVFLTIAP